MAWNIFGLLGNNGTGRSSPLQQVVERAFTEVYKLPQFVPAVLTASPEVAIRILEEMERICLTAASHMSEARALLESDPRKATTPVAVRGGEGGS